MGHNQSLKCFHSKENHQQNEGNLQKRKKKIFENNVTDMGDNIQSLHKSMQLNIKKQPTGVFLCAVIDLSGILWSLLIPEYSEIKKRGMPFPELRNPGMSFVSFSIR